MLVLSGGFLALSPCAWLFTAVCIPSQSAEHVIEGVMVKINRAGPRPEHEHPLDEKPQTAPSVASFTVRHWLQHPSCTRTAICK